MNEVDMNEIFGLSDSSVYRKLSYSRISDFDRNGPKVLEVRSSLETKGMSLGKLVDDLLLPTDNFVFEDNYEVSDVKSPTATSGRLCSIILDNFTEKPSNKEIFNICRENNFWAKSLDDTLMANIEKEEIQSYLDFKFSTINKSLVDSETYYKATDLKNRLLTHEHSKYVFDKSFNSINQYKFEFEYNGIVLRGAIDRVLIDHENKTVEFIDLKTGAGTLSEFYRSYLRYRYDLQALIYTLSFDKFCVDNKLEGYELIPFKFMYIGVGEMIPLIYETTDKWLEASLKGFKVGSYTYRGLIELTDEIKWHFDNNLFDLSRDIYESNGLVKLDDGFINLLDNEIK